jgi:hypothetical protein
LRIPWIERGLFQRVRDERHRHEVLAVDIHLQRAALFELFGIAHLDRQRGQAIHVHPLSILPDLKTDRFLPV